MCKRYPFHNTSSTISIRLIVELFQSESGLRAAAECDISIMAVIQKLIEHRLKAVIVTDKERRPISKISLKHILKFYFESEPSSL